MTINSNPYWIGRSSYVPDPNRYFDGLIDEVAIFDEALTQPEIEALYDKGFAGESYCETSSLPDADFDDDGDCDGSDLALFAADFGRTDCP